MKKIIATLMILAVVASVFTGCAKKEEAKGPIVMRLAETHAKDYPTEQADREFARLVNERTKGRIQIEVYPSAQLGEEKAAIEQVQFGAIDFTRVSVSVTASFAPQLNALQLPYVFRDGDHEFKVLKGPIGDKLLKSLEASGFIGLCWYDSGSRNFYNSKKEIKSPEDLKGLKIRVQQTDLMVKMVNSLGAVATPMAFGEVYSGLQTKVIDGAENNWPSYQSTSHFEVAKYFTVDEHTRVPEVLLASKIAMEKLSKEDQAIIIQAAKDSVDFQLAKWKAAEVEAEKFVTEKGAIITRIADKSAFQAAMKPIYDAQPADIQALVAEIQAVK